MTHKFEKEFFTIINQIVGEDKSLEEWAEVASDDIFQEGNYVGGFDSIEMEFTFSLYSEDKEYWFQLSLEDILKIKEKKLDEVEIRPAA